MAKDSKNEKDFIKEVTERHRQFSDYWDPARKRWHENMAMYTGEQWTQTDRDARGANRPVLTVPMLKQPVQQLVNDARQNRIGPRLTGVSGDTDRDTAQVIEDLIRSQQYGSQASVAHEYALEMAAAGSYGFFRIRWEYVGDSFQKRIITERIEDPTTVLMDPFSTMADGSDMEHCFIELRMSKDQHKRAWPDAEVVKANFFEHEANPAPGYITEEGVLVLEYWYIDYGATKTRYQLENGIELDKEQFDEMFGELPEGEAPAIANEREVRTKTVYQCFTNGVEVLEKNEWLDEDSIPIIPVWGKELWVNGKRKLISVIDDSHDSQRFLNYMVSAAAENVALSPKAPYIAEEGQIEDHPEWETANTDHWAVLPYKAVSVDNSLVPPPQRNQFEPAIQGLSFLTELGKNFIMETHGIPRVGFGQQDNRIQSGTAIRALQKEGDTANFHIHDNLKRAVEREYRILTRLLPKIIDVERQIRIVGENNAEQVVSVFRTLHQGQDVAAVAYETEKGETKRGILDPNLYDVRVSTGPSYNTRKQETAAQLAELLPHMPQVGQLGPDIIIRSLDLNEGDELADRVTPPQFKSEDDRPPLPPEVQQQMVQAKQMIEALTQKVQELEAEKQAKVTEHAMEKDIEAMKLASKEAVESMKEQFRAWAENEKLTTQENNALLQQAIAQLQAVAQPGPAGGVNGGANAPQNG